MGTKRSNPSTCCVALAAWPLVVVRRWEPGKYWCARVLFGRLGQSRRLAIRRRARRFRESHKCWQRGHPHGLSEPGRRWRRTCTGDVQGAGPEYLDMLDQFLGHAGVLKLGEPGDPGVLNELFHLARAGAQKVTHSHDRGKCGLGTAAPHIPLAPALIRSKDSCSSGSACKTGRGVAMGAVITSALFRNVLRQIG